MHHKLFCFLAVTLSGGLTAAAFPSVGVSGLIWVSLVPLLFILTRCRPLAALAYAFVFCLVFHSGLFFWMFQLPHYAYRHHLLLGIWLTIWLGAAALAINLVARRFGALPALASAPFVWVVYEWLRSNVGFLSLPWGLLAQSQYSQTLLIQSADFAGIWGLSALIVAVNSTLTACAYPVWVKIWGLKTAPGQSPGRRGLVGFALIVTVVLVANIAYGRWACRRSPTGPGIRVAAVQGNIEQHRKWDETQKAEIMATYESLSLAAGRQGTDLIIWPETATPQSISVNLDLYRRVASIADQTQTPILLGSAQVVKFKPGDQNSRVMKNTAYLITPGKRLIRQRYDKMRLLPFGEYLPFDSVVPWQRLNIPSLSSYTPGTKAHVFFFKGNRFAAPICWENIFPQDTRMFVQNGAQFIVNITNEAWFGQSAAPYQFLAMNVFRAVENRRSVVRCANTGVSCIIDPCGQIVDRVRDSAGADIFVRGVLNANVILNDQQTLYTRWGDWFVGMSLALWVMLVIGLEFRRSRSHVKI